MITEIKCWNRATEKNFFVLLSIKQKRVALTFKSVYVIEGVTIQIKPLQQYFSCGTVCSVRGSNF